MANFGESNRARLSRVWETEFGTTPTNPDFQIMRVTSSDLAANKQTVVSNELRFDRQTADLAEVGFESSGTIPGELSLGGTYNEDIEAALCGTWSAGMPKSTLSLSVAATGTNATLTDDGAGGHFTNVVTGQMVYLSNMQQPANNGWRAVVSVESADEIIVSEDYRPMVTAAGTGTEYARGQSITNGVVQRSASVEQAFTDVGVYQLFKGQRIGSMEISTESNAIVTCSFGYMGTETIVDEQTPPTPPVWLGSGSYSNPTTTPVINATSNVGSIHMDGVVLPNPIRSLSLSLDNALRSQPAVGNKFPVGIGYGRVAISGTMDVYLVDLKMYSAMLDHDDVELRYSYTDTAGNSMHLILPRVKFASSNPAPEGIDTDVMETIEWQAILDLSGSRMIQIDIA